MIRDRSAGGAVYAARRPAARAGRCRQRR